MKLFIYLICSICLLQSCIGQENKSKTNKMDSTEKSKNPYYSKTEQSKLAVKDDDWKKVLSPEVYYIAREKGTERAWTSKFEAFKEAGTYYCAVCGNALFKSDTKFDSGCGWPSFYEPISKGSIIYLP
ncbi:MAG: peptide-methionine (R)-S-oxide reductase, partial [Sphingobacteriia bacterium]